MAIVKGTFATNFSKRIGKVSFANRQGKNIARQRPASVKNPMTEGQQRQRMIFTTVQAAYKKMQPICGHSFEGYSYGAKSMSRFMKLNLKALKDTKLGVNFKGNVGIVAPNEFVISEGSLLSPGLADRVEAQTVTSAVRLADTVTVANATVAQFLEATGTKLGQQLTFISVASPQVGSVAAGEMMQPKYSSIKISRIILKTDLVGTELMLNASGKLNTEILSDNSESTTELTFAIDAEHYVTWKHGWTTNSDIMCAAVILSEKQVSSWARSSETMVAQTPVDFGDWTFTQAKVLETYNPKSAYYLNNATV